MLSGKKIVLEPITKEHTPLIIKWRNNPKVRYNFIFQELFTEEIHNDWMETKVATGDVVQFVIRQKENGSLIGSVYLRDIDKKNEKAEFGIFIGEDIERGKGYGAEAARLICRYGFKELGLHKIMLRVFANNICAIKAYEHAGFKKEAYLKDEVKINGMFEDMIFMALINDECTIG